MPASWLSLFCFGAAACLLVALLSSSATMTVTAEIWAAPEEANVADAARLSLMQTQVVVDKREQVMQAKAMLAAAQQRVAEGHGDRNRVGMHPEFQPVPPLLAEEYAMQPPTAPPGNANAEATGVSLNAEGDLDAFISGLIAYSGACCFFIAVFTFFKRWYPMMYTNNVKVGAAPGVIPEGTFGWMHASLNAKIPKFAETRGLDMAMLLEYTQLCMRILATIGIPMCCIFGPMNYIFGGFAAGSDYLSYFSFGNVQNGRFHYWVYAFVVWYVVFVVQYLAFQAQAKFLEMRYHWLKNLSEPRASTILVENIPDKYRSDEKLKGFFDSLFTKGSISSASVVKDTSALLSAEREQDRIAQKLTEAEAIQGSMAATLESDLETAKGRVAEARAKVLKEAEAVGGVNLSSGFVTFTSRRDALVAENLIFGTSYDVMVVSVPPPDSSVIWNDLKLGSNTGAAWAAFGYALVAGLYIVYLPLTIWITRLATNFNMGPFQSLWESAAPTMGIQIMVAFLPTFLLLIFRFCFVLKDDAWAQLRLQNWYFVFQVVFVILITAISSNVGEFMQSAFTDPTSIPILLGESMPYATHFYMNFMVLQWMTHSMNLTRYIQLAKYWIFSSIFESEKARAMSEPEDQDYYGIGSRSARFSINMLICIIFGTLCPWMSLLGFVNFFVCRLHYGYLMGFAETKKPDLGGLFWVQKLRNLFIGCIIYVIMMTGVLYSRAATGEPAIISALALVFVIMRMRRFEEAHVWERLPFEILANEPMDKKADDGKYVQPELLEGEDREKQEMKMGMLSAMTTYIQAKRAKH
jgi:hypothetical protein